MLSGKQKRYLRSLMNEEKAVAQIGKEGISLNLIKTLDNYLKVHEIMKIQVLKTCPFEIKEIALDVAAQTKTDIVQIIGRVIIIYRPSKEKLIKLP